MEADDFDVSMRAGARAGRRKNIRPPCAAISILAVSLPPRVPSRMIAPSWQAVEIR